MNPPESPYDKQMPSHIAAEPEEHTWMVSHIFKWNLARTKFQANLLMAFVAILCFGLSIAILYYFIFYVVE